MIVNNQNEANTLELYKSLFKGREDVFAIRWGKDNKSGYSPAYDLKWEEIRQHKAKGGTIANFENKTQLPLTDEVIRKHLGGLHFIGIYPLLKDNTSWFVAVDFDDKKWVQDCRKFLSVCQQEKIPCYLERSRSGNGGHAWIFFQEPYPSVNSRKIFLHLLTVSGVVVNKQRTGSFDRIFPNQDFHSGKGFGNLIALPLNSDCFQNGNNCFIDPDTLEPYSDQWAFLSKIQRISSTELDTLFLKFGGENTVPKHFDGPTDDSSGLKITLSSQISIEKSKAPALLLSYIKEQVSFQNSEYWSKRNQGRNTWDTPIKLNYQQANESHYLLPRGMIGKILRFCKEKVIPFEFSDLRKKQVEVTFASTIELRQHQYVAIEASRKRTLGLLLPRQAQERLLWLWQLLPRKNNPPLSSSTESSFWNNGWNVFRRSWVFQNTKSEYWETTKTVKERQSLWHLFRVFRST